MVYFNLFMIPISTYCYLTSENDFWKFVNGVGVVLCILSVALHIAIH